MDARWRHAESKKGRNGERGASAQCGRETAMVGWATSGSESLPFAFALRKVLKQPLEQMRDGGDDDGAPE